MSIIGEIVIGLFGLWVFVSVAKEWVVYAHIREQNRSPFDKLKRLDRRMHKEIRAALKHGLTTSHIYNRYALEKAELYKRYKLNAQVDWACPDRWN